MTTKTTKIELLEEALVAEIVNVRQNAVIRQAACSHLAVLRAQAKPAPDAEQVGVAPADKTYDLSAPIGLSILSDLEKRLPNYKHWWDRFRDYIVGDIKSCFLPFKHEPVKYFIERRKSPSAAPADTEAK